MKMNYRVEDLKDVISANLAQHIETYETAMAGFRQTVKDELRENLDYLEQLGDDWTLEDLDDNTLFGRRSFHMDIMAPENHEEDYGRVWDMLDMTSDETIELNEEQFNKYVRDQWDWSQSFQMSTAAYVER